MNRQSSTLSLWSSGSVLSIGSKNSVLSIGSIGRGSDVMALDCRGDAVTPQWIACDPTTSSGGQSDDSYIATQEHPRRRACRTEPPYLRLWHGLNFNQLADAAGSGSEKTRCGR